MKSAKSLQPLVVRGRRDTGTLELRATLVENMHFDSCSLSVGGHVKRSRFNECVFRNITGTTNVIGTPVFERCTFENVDGGNGVALYGALFTECVVGAKLDGFTFGFDAKGIYPKAIIDDNLRIASSSSFCLDIREADVRDVGFIGDLFPRKVRFRERQCLILSGDDMQAKLLPLLRSTVSEDFATLLATAASQTKYRENLTVVPSALRKNLDHHIKQIESAGLSVRTTPYC